MSIPRVLLLLMFATSACVQDDAEPEPPPGDPEGKADGAWAAVYTLGVERDYALSPDGYTLFTTPGGGIPVVQLRAATTVPAWRWTGSAWTRLDLAAGRELALDARAALYVSVGPSTGTLRIGLDHDAMYFSDVTGTGAFGDADVDGNGVVNTADVTAAAAAVIPTGGVDVAFVKAALAGTQPTVIAADAYEGRVELLGLGLAAGKKVTIGGATHAIASVTTTSTGMRAATIWIEGPRPAHGAWVELVGTTQRVGRPLQALNGAPPTVIEEPMLTETGPGSAPASEPATSDCCLKSITFRNPGTGKIRLFAFEASGRAAGNNGPELAAGKRTRLSADCTVIELVVYDVRDGEDVLAGRFRLRCEDLTTGVLSEPLPPAPPGGTQVRARPLIEILAIERGECDEAARVWADGVRQGMIPHDNSNDWAHGRTGSGALVQLNAAPDALAAQGCRQWCWVQTAETTLELQRAGTTDWQVLIDTEPHNDNLDTDDKQIPDRRTNTTRTAPWYCYPLQEIDADGRLIMSDGPHIKHTASVPVDADPDHDVALAEGDVIKRTSRFRSTMMCYDPRPVNGYNSYTWSLTTLYRHPTGASSRVDGPDAAPLNPRDPHVRAALDKAKLRRHLDKSEERRR